MEVAIKGPLEKARIRQEQGGALATVPTCNSWLKSLPSLRSTASNVAALRSSPFRVVANNSSRSERSYRLSKRRSTSRN